MNLLRRRPFSSPSSVLRLLKPYTSPHPSPPSQCRRFYYTDRHHVTHFRRRGPHRFTSLNPSTVLVIAVVGLTGAATVYFANLETVPYTKRSHVILLSSSVERQLGEAQFRQLKDSLKGHVLPPLHPDSVRVHLISKQIIGGLQRGLHQGDRVWSDMEYAAEPSSAPRVFPDGGEERGREVVDWGFEEERRKVSGEVRWSREDEVLDDTWVREKRRKGDRSGPTTGHLEGLNWEVVVVRDPLVNAMCMPGGKIVVFTGLLDHFKTDAEIATVIGHEVGHAVARHVAEGITRNLWLILVQLILLQFFAMPDLINALSNILLRFPFSRRMEMEADYIGLLLMASAGYDPRVAPTVYQKLGQIGGDSELKNYLSTHPSSKRRAELLSQAHVMEDALNLYRESVAGRGIEGFL